jgi:hypothetical protein
MWTVALVHDISRRVRHEYGEGYFPRKYFRRRDADRLADRVASLGGEARVERFKK